MWRRSFALLTLCFAYAATTSSDPLADAIARWQAFLATPEASAKSWTDVKPIAESILPRAQDALQHSRRLLALYRFATVRPLLEAAAYASRHAEKDFDREWKRSRPATPPAQSFDSIKLAAARALAEAAALRSRGYYDASRDYAANTTPAIGLFYIGQSLGEHSTIDFMRSMNAPHGGRTLTLRPLAPDIDSLSRELLAAYKPPASIDSHSQFIGVSALIKEAHELDAAGLRDGALIRYLESAFRFAQIGAKPLPRPDIESRLREFAPRVRDAATDHSIAEIYLEAAESDLEANPAEPKAASAVVTAVLPRYFAALAPPAPQPQLAAARATVTLVRWPYT
jgi:hypothetical protein